MWVEPFGDIGGMEIDMIGYDDLAEPMKFNSLTNHWSPIAFMPGELSLSMPAPPLPSADRQAIIALLTGNWRALLDSAISSASQQLWSMVPDPMIMDDDPWHCRDAQGNDPCAKIWKNANAVTNPCTVVGWYGKK